MYFRALMQTVIGTSPAEARDFLREGQLVAIPTETVYGLAANALSAEAVLSVFTVKNRPAFDPLIVHVSSIESAEQYAIISDAARNLMHRYWPGPLTLLLPKKDIIPDIVTSGLDTVGLRMPSHPLTLKLLESLHFPLAAPSANPFGYISPTTAQHVADQLSGKIPYILNGGSCEVGIESTIAGFENEKLIIYRLGGITIEELRSVYPDVELKISNNSNPSAPGMLDTHYAPRKPLLFGNADELVKEAGDNVVILCLKKRNNWNYPVVELSSTGNLNDAAVHLFAALRKLDQSSYKSIIADVFPMEGLGRAINDRLKRASVNK